MQEAEKGKITEKLEESKAGIATGYLHRRRSVVVSRKSTQKVWNIITIPFL